MRDKYPLIKKETMVSCDHCQWESRYQNEFLTGQLIDVLSQLSDGETDLDKIKPRIESVIDYAEGIKKTTPNKNMLSTLAKAKQVLYEGKAIEFTESKGLNE